jgi:hypothetical protein
MSDQIESRSIQRPSSQEQPVNVAAQFTWKRWMKTIAQRRSAEFQTPGL